MHNGAAPCWPQLTLLPCAGQHFAHPASKQLQPCEMFEGDSLGTALRERKLARVQAQGASACVGGGGEGHAMASASFMFFVSSADGEAVCMGVINICCR